MSHVRADLKLALRGWKRSPLVAAVAVLSMALGIGANTAIFTLVDQVLLRTLPVKEPRALVQVVPTGMKYGSNWGDGSELSNPMYLDLRDNNQVFSGMFARFGNAFHIGYAGQTERVSGEIVSGTYFPVLGVNPVVGRLLSPDDDLRPGGHPLAVLSYTYWSNRFASDPAIVGRALVINGHPFTVIGVAQSGFEGIELGRECQVFVPLAMKAQVTPGQDWMTDRRWHWLRVFGRLEPGVTATQAQASLQPFYKSRLEMEVNEPAFANASESARQRFLAGELVVEPGAQGRSSFRRSLTTPLWVLMAIAAGVLVIACANVANLLLARGAAREREVALRMALGASKTRLVGQLLVESVLLSGLGGLCGLAVSVVGAPLVLRFLSDPTDPSPVSTTPDLRILGFTFALAMATGVLFGIVPALQATRPALAPTLKDQAGSVLGGATARLRKALVASQVAVSLLLLLGAALFLRTLDNLLAVDVGLKTDQLLVFSVSPALSGYTPERSQQTAKTLVERLNGVPGVAGAALASMRLLEGNQWSSGYTVSGYTPKADENMVALNNAVSPGYFKAMGMSVLMGRDFDDRDQLAPGAAPNSGTGPPPFRVAIANQQFVRHFFGDENPIGRHIGFGRDPNTPTPIEIIGVVSDAKYTDVRSDTQKQLFFSIFETRDPGDFSVYVRTDREADTVFRAARQSLQALDPNLPVHRMQTLDRQLQESLGNERLVAAMSATFGTLATLLAIVGLYGVMAFTVARRTREIGVRMALGARATDIGLLVLRESLAVAAAGVALGLPCAWWLGRYVASQLYGVKPTDPVTLLGTIAVLAVVSAAAALAPSARAARIEPTRALRTE